MNLNIHFSTIFSYRFKLNLNFCFPSGERPSFTPIHMRSFVSSFMFENRFDTGCFRIYWIVDSQIIRLIEAQKIQGILSCL
jgi:hypothetical protein